jgi:hypothetical protein
MLIAMFLAAFRRLAVLSGVMVWSYGSSTVGKLLVLLVISSPAHCC